MMTIDSAPASVARPLASTTLAEAIRVRRTFAILSHPDAGKTTLTERLLLHGGAVQEAGMVKARRGQRRATSDWMRIEQERGISVTSTVLQFEYDGYSLNLLDTPGHEDFSEDTYRTLLAADSAIMVIDAAKGIEAQTRKLFRVCRQRGIPIVTFINKMDRPTRDVFELLDQIERELSIRTVAMNWPIIERGKFLGVCDRETRLAHMFAGAPATAVGGPAVDADESLDSTPHVSELADWMDPSSFAQLEEELALLDAAGEPFDRGHYLTGQQTPVFFGSALTGFGVQLFLDAFVAMAPPPSARRADIGPVPPDREGFAGFVFKIQSNMDPKHRDSVAFVRVCAGRFERDMWVDHVRTGKRIRLSRPHRTFAQSREIMEEAYPGDVVGLVNPGVFAVGDSISSGPPVSFEALGRFAPELFARIRNVDTARYKQFQVGVRQLEAEGAMQVFVTTASVLREPVVGVVGRLQLDVVQFRLETEYGVETRLEWLPHTTARVLTEVPEGGLNTLSSSVMRLIDADGATVLLFPSAREADFWQERLRLSLREIGAEAGALQAW